jgi:hypothetical protein
MTICDLHWKRSEDKGKARWEKVGILMEKNDGKKSVKIDLVPVGQWDGWLVVSERRAKEDRAGWEKLDRDISDKAALN